MEEEEEEDKENREVGNSSSLNLAASLLWSHEKLCDFAGQTPTTLGKNSDTGLS